MNVLENPPNGTQIPIFYNICIFFPTLICKPMQEDSPTLLSIFFRIASRLGQLKTFLHLNICSSNVNSVSLLGWQYPSALLNLPLTQIFIHTRVLHVVHLETLCLLKSQLNVNKKNPLTLENAVFNTEGGKLKTFLNPVWLPYSYCLLDEGMSTSRCLPLS